MKSKFKENVKIIESESLLISMELFLRMIMYFMIS